MELSRKRASSSLNLECSQEHVQPLQSHVGSPLSSIPNVVSSSFDEPIFKKAWFRFGIAGRSVDEGQRRTHFPNMSTFTDGSQGCVDVKGRLVPGRYTLQNNALIRQRPSEG